MDRSRSALSELDAAKAEWRARLRACLAEMTVSERQRQSALVCARVNAIAQFREAPVVVLYRSLPTEVDIGELWSCAREARREVFCPRLDAGGNSLRFVRVTGDSRWRQTTLGFWEPEDASEIGDAQVATAAIVVPGLGFTRTGDRIGRGRGFYDRALSAPPIGSRGIRIGVGFDTQIVDCLPVGSGDIAMHLVVAASRVWPSHSHFDPSHDISS